MLELDKIKKALRYHFQENVRQQRSHFIIQTPYNNEDNNYFIVIFEHENNILSNWKDVYYYKVLRVKEGFVTYDSGRVNIDDPSTQISKYNDPYKKIGSLINTTIRDHLRDNGESW